MQISNNFSSPNFGMAYRIKNPETYNRYTRSLPTREQSATCRQEEKIAKKLKNTKYVDVEGDIRSLSGSPNKSHIFHTAKVPKYALSGDGKSVICTGCEEIPLDEIYCTGDYTPLGISSKNVVNKARQYERAAKKEYRGLEKEAIERAGNTQRSYKISHK